MSQDNQSQPDLFSGSTTPHGIDESAKPSAKAALRVIASPDKPLTKRQAELNRLMKSLEKARSEHAREQRYLDNAMATAIRDLMPLVEQRDRTECDLVFAAKEALDSAKLSNRRRDALADLILGKADALLYDGVGLEPTALSRLEELVKLLAPVENRSSNKEAFEMLRDFLESEAKTAGLDLDLGGLDMDGDRADFDDQIRARLQAADESFRQNSGKQTTGGRKPTKAQLAKEQRFREQEEAKKRDIKTLYKQLAKVLHPDLETDPVLKQHKEAWMKRLTTAYSKGDLRDLLEIEMEWLGEEESNLTRASDEKLKVYCMVLKEQIAELKEQTYYLIEEPQYDPLRRFVHPVSGRPQPADRIKMTLIDENANLAEILIEFRAGGAAQRKMINQWAEDHARAMTRGPFF